MLPSNPYQYHPWVWVLGMFTKKSRSHVTEFHSTTISTVVLKGFDVHVNMTSKHPWLKTLASPIVSWTSDHPNHLPPWPHIGDSLIHTANTFPKLVACFSILFTVSRTLYLIFLQLILPEFSFMNHGFLVKLRKNFPTSIFLKSSSYFPLISCIISFLHVNLGPF